MANYWNHLRKHPRLESIPSIHINHSGVAGQFKSKVRSEQMRIPGMAGECTTQTGVRLSVRATACHYGRLRYWFVCPGCNGNRLVLRYLEKGNAYYCNNCLNGVHASSQMGKSDRVNKATWKRLEKYGLDKLYSGLDFLDTWARPKGMHRKTWQRIMDKHNKTLLSDPLFQKYMGYLAEEKAEIQRYKASKARLSA